MAPGLVRRVPPPDGEEGEGGGAAVGGGGVGADRADRGGKGYSCLAEIRTVETILDGQPATDVLKAGDRVRIWMEDDAGHSIFGAIEQELLPA
jgi:fumarylacetoacetate (FAA) hydrolase